MKSKLFSIGFTSLLALVVAAPAAFSSSSSYSFTLDNRVVDGSKNGQYHNLSKGSATISGKQHQYSSDPKPVGPNTISYQLWNKSSGNSFGVVKSVPNSDGTSNSVKGTYSGLGGGSKYYLLIFRTDDGRNIKGSGTVSN